MTTRRSFLGAVLAAGVAPVFLRADRIMPVKHIVLPDWHHWCGIDWGTDEGGVIEIWDQRIIRVGAGDKSRRFHHKMFELRTLPVVLPDFKA